MSRKISILCHIKPMYHILPIEYQCYAYCKSRSAIPDLYLSKYNVTLNSGCQVEIMPHEILLSDVNCNAEVTFVRCHATRDKQKAVCALFKYFILDIFVFLFAWTMQIILCEYNKCSEGNSNLIVLRPWVESGNKSANFVAVTPYRWRQTIRLHNNVTRHQVSSSNYRR